MNRILSAILLLSLIIFGCSDKPMKSIFQSTRNYKCKDGTGQDYVLKLGNVESANKLIPASRLNHTDANKPITAIGFSFKSASKEKGYAYAGGLEIKKDDVDLKILDHETVVDGNVTYSDDFFLDSVVEFYFAVKRFELDDDIWKRISIEPSIYRPNHPYHNSKSNCSLIQQ